jgi:hypothetical protein
MCVLPVGSPDLLPMAGGNNDWAVVPDLNTTEVIAFVPIDPF